VITTLLPSATEAEELTGAADEAIALLVGTAAAVTDGEELAADEEAREEESERVEEAVGA
jgi:hypothetical protein